MKKNVFIFGNGLIGSAIYKKLKENPDINIVSSTEESVSIRRVLSVPPCEDLDIILRELITVHGQPHVLINTIGVIGKPNVDWCEDNKTKTKYGNVDIAVSLAKIACTNNIPFIHVSTGCIFDGPGIWSTDSQPNFSGSYYSWSKMETERQLRDISIEFSDAYIEIHRIRMPFFDYSNERNLFDKLLTYDMIVDAPNSMTCLDDYVLFVSERVNTIIENKTILSHVDHFNIFHAVNKGSITHKEVVDLMHQHTQIKIKPKKFITPSELNAITRVPRSNCVLGNEMLPDIYESIISCITKFEYSYTENTI